MLAIGLLLIILGAISYFFELNDNSIYLDGIGIILVTIGLI